MTTIEFRQHSEYVAHMRQVLEDPVVQMWLEALDESENPMNKVAPPEISPHGAFIMLGEQTGWRMFRQRFMLGGQIVETQQGEEEATYQDTPEEPESEKAA